MPTEGTAHFTEEERRRVWLGGVRPRISEQRVLDVVSEFGDIEHIDVNFAGYAFVLFKEEASARRCIENLHGSHGLCSNDKTISVALASPKGYREACRRRDEPKAIGAGRNSVRTSAVSNAGGEARPLPRPPPPPPAPPLAPIGNALGQKSLVTRGRVPPPRRFFRAGSCARSMARSFRGRMRRVSRSPRHTSRSPRRSSRSPRRASRSPRRTSRSPRRRERESSERRPRTRRHSPSSNSRSASRSSRRAEAAAAALRKVAAADGGTKANGDKGCGEGGSAQCDPSEINGRRSLGRNRPGRGRTNSSCGRRSRSHSGGFNRSRTRSRSRRSSRSRSRQGCERRRASSSSSRMRERERRRPASTKSSRSSPHRRRRSRSFSRRSSPSRRRTRSPSPQASELRRQETTTRRVERGPVCVTRGPDPLGVFSDGPTSSCQTSSGELNVRRRCEDPSGSLNGRAASLGVLDASISASLVGGEEKQPSQVIVQKDEDKKPAAVVSESTALPSVPQQDPAPMASAAPPVSSPQILCERSAPVLEVTPVVAGSRSAGSAYDGQPPLVEAAPSIPDLPSQKVAATSSLPGVVAPTPTGEAAHDVDCMAYREPSSSLELCSPLLVNGSAVSPLHLAVEIIDIALSFQGRRKLVRHLSTTKAGSIVDLHPIPRQVERRPLVLVDADGYEIGKEMQLGLLVSSGRGDGCRAPLELTLQPDAFADFGTETGSIVSEQKVARVS